MHRLLATGVGLIAAHLQFARGTSLERAHGLAHDVQDAIATELPGTSVLVHIAPEDRVREDRFKRASGRSGRTRLTPQA